MAKGKHAAALFEVIHTDKRFGKAKDPAEKLSTPKWWFKSRMNKGPQPPIDMTPAAAAATPRTAAEAPPVFVPPPAAPAPIVAPQPSIDESAADPTMSATARSLGRGSRVAVNPDRGEIQLKLTYTSAIVGTFALVVVLGLAYLLGRHLTRGPTPVLASTEDVRRGPALPGVLDVGDGAAQRAPAPVANAPAVVSTPRPTATTSTPAAPRGARAAAPAQPPETIVVEDGKRTNGLQYVVIQSYPSQEEDLARAAAELLTKHGVGVTVERGIKGWPPSWFIVVGTRGFDRTGNSPEFDAYIKKIKDVSTKFAGTSKFKRFDPTVKRWDQTR